MCPTAKPDAGGTGARPRRHHHSHLSMTAETPPPPPPPSDASGSTDHLRNRHKHSQQLGRGGRGGGGGYCDNRVASEHCRRIQHEDGDEARELHDGRPCVGTRAARRGQLAACRRGHRHQQHSGDLLHRLLPGPRPLQVPAPSPDRLPSAQHRPERASNRQRAPYSRLAGARPMWQNRSRERQRPSSAAEHSADSAATASDKIPSAVRGRRLDVCDFAFRFQLKFRAREQNSTTTSGKWHIEG